MLFVKYTRSPTHVLESWQSIPQKLHLDKVYTKPRSLHHSNMTHACSQHRDLPGITNEILQRRIKQPLSKSCVPNMNKQTVCHSIDEPDSLL